MPTEKRDWRSYGNIRIDARNQADPAVQAGMRNIHRGTDGSVIGGVTAEGQPIGTKNRSGSRFRGMAPTPGTTRPASGALLTQRQNLFQRMQAAGAAGITPAMRSEARQLGVDDAAFNRALETIPAAATPPAAPASPAAAAPPPASPALTPAMTADVTASGGDLSKLPTDVRMRVQGKTSTGGVPVNKVAAPAAPASPPAAKQTGTRINSLTGLPMGYRPGDVVAPQFQAAANESVQRQASAPPMQASTSPAAPVSKFRRGPASQPPQVGIVPRKDGYTAKSDLQTNREQDAANAARQSGTMGDYFARQGNAKMAAAFPNRTTNRQAVGIPMPAKAETPSAFNQAESSAAASFYGAQKPQKTGGSRFRGFRL